jgi:ubiquinone/menaquinone biosynthesis C-methylase UbiE
MGWKNSPDMEDNDTIIPDKASAEGYDDQARATHWLGPQVVFGLMYEYIQSGEKLLDLGIGSGLSSILFHKAGLRIYGLDGSADILEICARKGLTVELKLHDLRSLPLPYADCSFDHVLCVAVLNSFKDLAGLFTEVGRILKPQGIFAFTVEVRKPGEEESYEINRVEVNEKPKTESAVRLYRHSGELISRWLEESRFCLLNALEFLAFEYPAEGKNVYFKAFCARKS